MIFLSRAVKGEVVERYGYSFDRISGKGRNKDEQWRSKKGEIRFSFRSCLADNASPKCTIFPPSRVLSWTRRVLYRYHRLSHPRRLLLPPFVALWIPCFHIAAFRAEEGKRTEQTEAKQEATSCSRLVLLHEGSPCEIALFAKQTLGRVQNQTDRVFFYGSAGKDVVSELETSGNKRGI